ncbi:trichohyalin-like [Juglans microcarpa x Juglans regia]|uniref:trichohyalin-like n=1 Tax=Juglans microcarpa x Juglans regia TaxID=2249226 RepID=UPI001B7EBC4D|nr:trichohyalin-like [Juglans microcarpa x Juglans regia]
MEPNGVGGGMFPNIDSGMLGLELPLQQQLPQRQKSPANPQNLHRHHLQISVSYPHHETDHNPPQSQQSVKHPYPLVKPKQAIALSDEDGDNSGDAKRKMSPWQRMKWTDTMVRLLIMAVYYMGDEAGSEGITDPTGSKKSAGLLQKKGKWKSVSRAMMEKGFYVSPQQCEDKFNDLNKRYKRVNDILGKGTACKVVENQSLLETMELSPKMKEEVRKLLNSKHLFFREMCAYHNSCGHGVADGAAGGANRSPEVAAEASHTQQQQAQQQQYCFHSSENPGMGGDGSKMLKGESGEEEEEDDEDVDDDSDEDEDEDGVESGSRGLSGHGHEDEDDNDERTWRKRARQVGFPASSQLVQQLSCEVMSVLQDGEKSQWEKKQWLRTRLIQLEEQQVSYQGQAFELEKQRLKWVKFSGKKEREMERAKLENERRRLENERMALLLRQKEMELLDLHQQQQQLQQLQHSSNKRGEPSSVTG